jgi:hypothetical protein
MDIFYFPSLLYRVTRLCDLLDDLFCGFHKLHTLSEPSASPTTFPSFSSTITIQPTGQPSESLPTPQVSPKASPGQPTPTALCCLLLSHLRSHRSFDRSTHRCALCPALCLSLCPEQLCPPGSYSNDGNISACMPCPPGSLPLSLWQSALVPL